MSLLRYRRACCLRPQGWLAALAAVGLLWASAPAAEHKAGIPFPFRQGDRVAWIGSSSTFIGVWPRTLEFLLRTRHPGLRLTFHRCTTGGGTFATGLAQLDRWLAEFKPTVVVFNYGANDAGAGAKGLPRFEENMARCVARVKAHHARVILMTPQAADVRKSGKEAAANRRLYATTMIAFARDKGWPVIDVFHPLEAMQKGAQKDDPVYSMLSDPIHLTRPAYVAWGCFLYDLLNPPAGESAATLTAAGQVTATRKCQIRGVQSDRGGLSFTRLDEVLPLLPPGPLPPRKYVPLEKRSRYLLTITGLAAGKYEILVEGKTLGVVDARTLAAGVNLNAGLLDSAKPAPWAGLAQKLWDGNALDQVGKTRWRFEVRKK